MADRDALDRWTKQAQDAFADFRSYRETWEELVHRDLTPNLDVRLGKEVAYYATPDLEEAEHDHADFMAKNPTRFAYAVREQGKQAEDAAKDAMLLAAHTWALVENRGGWIDRANALGQARYGVNVMRLLHQPIEEPEAKGLKDRDQAMKQRPWPFYFEQAPVLACSWLPKGQKTPVFCCEYDVPYLDRDEYAQKGKELNARNKDGNYEDDRTYVPGLADSKFCWVGEDEAVDTTLWQRKFKVIVVEYLSTEDFCPICSDGHPLWVAMELISGSTIKDAEILSQRILPYKRAGTYRLITGRNSNDTNPHWRYRPLNYRLIVEATVMNWALSTLQTLANRDSSDARVYLDTSKIPDEVAKRLPEEFWEEFKIKLPDAGGDEVPMVPGQLLAWPTNLAPVLWEVYQDAALRFKEAKPNRFVMGENFKEAADGTGSANLQATQQASLPYDWLLKQHDQFIREAKEDQFHAIRYWDYQEDQKTESKWFVNLTGDEPLSKGSSEAGQEVFVSASKLEYSFDLLLKTSSETLQEQAERKRQAFEAHDRGFIDDEQVLEDIGYHDVEAQQRRLAKYRLRKAMAPKKLALQSAVLDTILAAVADIDPTLLAGALPDQGAVVAQPEARPEVAGPSKPTISLPPVAGPGGANVPSQGVVI